MKISNNQQHKSRYKDIYELRSAKSMKNDISNLRKTSGLHQIRKGVKLCLKCDNPFESEDTITNRICHNCKNGFEHV